MDALTYLEKAGRLKTPSVVAVHGTEPYLKREVLAALRRQVLGADGGDFALAVHVGDKAVWAAVHDDLATLPFLATRRLVIVESADPFVTRERARLEKYFAAPAAGVLVLEVASWPSNTRLAALLGDAGSVACKAPSPAKLMDWCQAIARSRHEKPLAPDAARLLVDLVGPEMGLLDQELAKLAAYAGDAERITAADVDRLVGNNREENTWKIFDLIAAGEAAAALDLLGRLFDQGEDAMRLLGAFSMQLRRLAQVGRLTAQGTSIGEAMERAGVPPFGRRSAEAQIRHLGRGRLDQLYDWLLQTDFGMKGGSQLSPRVLMERLLLRMVGTSPALSTSKPRS